MDLKGAGLKQPVMLNIQKMPPRVNFELKSDPQALIGNRHRVDVYISKDHGIQLQSMECQIERIVVNDSREAFIQRHSNARHTDALGMQSVHMSSADYSDSTMENTQRSTRRQVAQSVYPQI